MPAGTPISVNRPVRSVAVVTANPSIMTSAPASGAPELESVTTPETMPVPDWAAAVTGSSARNTKRLLRSNCRIRKLLR